VVVGSLERVAPPPVVVLPEDPVATTGVERNCCVGTVGTRICWTVAVDEGDVFWCWPGCPGEASMIVADEDVEDDPAGSDIGLVGATTVGKVAANIK